MRSLDDWRLRCSSAAGDDVTDWLLVNRGRVPVDCRAREEKKSELRSSSLGFHHEQGNGATLPCSGRYWPWSLVAPDCVLGQGVEEEDLACIHRRLGMLHKMARLGSTPQLG